MWPMRPMAVGPLVRSLWWAQPADAGWARVVRAEVRAISREQELARELEQRIEMTLLDHAGSTRAALPAVLALAHAARGARRRMGVSNTLSHRAPCLSRWNHHVARFVADEILDNRRDALLAPFGADRFED